MLLVSIVCTPKIHIELEMLHRANYLFDNIDNTPLYQLLVYHLLSFKSLKSLCSTEEQK